MSGAIKMIKYYTEHDNQLWDDYVMCSKDATFFHLIGWKDVIESSFNYTPYYLMAKEGEEIKGVLPLFHIKSFLFGRFLVSVPFGVYGGICADNSEAADLLFEEGKMLATRLGVDYLELRNLNENGHSNIPAKDLYVTFRKEIFEDMDKNMAAIPRKQRRMIRIGIKNGFQSKMICNEYLKEFYDIYALSLRNLGNPVFPYSHFRSIIDVFGNACKILSIWNRDRLVAGVMTFFFKDTVMPFYAGALKDSYKYAVNDFMYWELMKYGCENGYKTFDFGRSKKGTGSFEFKRHWGFEPETLPYQYLLIKKMEMPDFSPANPKFKPLIEIWKRLPFPITKAIGPRFIKYFP
jgi:FemAB-related protein (PEP-CTERM system-associated)